MACPTGLAKIYYVHALQTRTALASIAYYCPKTHIRENSIFDFF